MIVVISLSWRLLLRLLLIQSIVISSGRRIGASGMSCSSTKSVCHSGFHFTTKTGATRGRIDNSHSAIRGHANTTNANSLLIDRVHEDFFGRRVASGGGCRGTGGGCGGCDGGQNAGRGRLSGRRDPRRGRGCRAAARRAQRGRDRLGERRLASTFMLTTTTDHGCHSTVPCRRRRLATRLCVIQRQLAHEALDTRLLFHVVCRLVVVA